ncbi:aldose epimerase family protein [Pleomorphomonas sp. NRK KF1]|uniref:aldose epimerase family protein n=1 Tax=Pleomorphomonas sp. NRK KF1 TaxID=2943000 RepID=UPI002044CB38|nr:aldose epimerase family protein [Pleomorphomonas sp. NRK KF1]MCM5553275.1 galactose mutarotase [Pleomorphomonas sp. NRK KF1]
MTHPVEDFITLDGDNGLKAVFSPAGAQLVAFYVPTSSGGPVQTVIGSPGRLNAPDGDGWAGTICGRFANRIAGASFTLDGTTYRLPANEGSKQLHGGANGFGHLNWEVERASGEVVFRLDSPDGDMGFPGALAVKAAYGLKGQTLYLEMTATTTKPTVVNLTNHVYWNLLGKGDILGHLMQIPASRYTPVDADLIPLGPLADVVGTRFDFREKRPIAGPYDQNFVLDAGRGELHLGARAIEPVTGRTLEVWTTEPAIQLYTGEHFTPAIKAPFSEQLKNAGFALEPQTFPNAPNEPSYPSSVLRPGETYRHRIEWRFSGF